MPVKIFNAGQITRVEHTPILVQNIARKQACDVEINASCCTQSQPEKIENFILYAQCLSSFLMDQI